MQIHNWQNEQISPPILNIKQRVCVLKDVVKEHVTYQDVCLQGCELHWVAVLYIKLVHVLLVPYSHLDCLNEFYFKSVPV